MSTAELLAIVEKLAISQAETDRQMKETDLKMQETDLKIKSMTRSVESLSGSIGREWGNLVESLTKTNCLEQMQALGIEVTQTAEATESERPGFEQEWDVLLINGGELVAVEVKSRLREGHLDRMVDKLEVFKKAFPQYTGYRVYGAVAALKYNSHLNRVAQKKGFFVFEPSGKIMKITNKPGFKPKAY